MMAAPPSARPVQAGSGPGVAPVAGGSASVAPPPFILPGEHFAAALVFLLLGSAGLVAEAPQLAQGAFPAPRVIAATHLFTLGWITTSIMGALYQFLPVALGEPVRSVRAGHAAFALYVPGLVLFVGGLAFGVHAAMLAGAAVFGTGIVVFAGNLGATLRRSARRDVTWWALACANAFLIVTLALGLALAGNLRWGYLGAGRFGAVGTHLHVALAGWVLLVMVGVAQRLLPMFLLSHGVGTRAAKLAVALIASGAGILAVLHHAPPLIARWLPAALIGAGLIAFLVQAGRFYRHRHRPALDPGMRLAAAALAILALTLVFAGPVVWRVATPRLATAYVMSAILGISLFVAAHYYKIVPFLIWYHRFGSLAGRQPVPRVGELYSARIAAAAAALLATGALLLIVSVAAGWPGATMAGALLFAAGATIEASQMLLLAQRRPA